jgi:hypothetical protein
VFARVFAVEECRVNGNVTTLIVQLRLSAQQHYGECCLDPVKSLTNVK